MASLTNEDDMKRAEKKHVTAVREALAGHQVDAGTLDSQTAKTLDSIQTGTGVKAGKVKEDAAAREGSAVALEIQRHIKTSDRDVAKVLRGMIGRAPEVLEACLGKLQIIRDAEVLETRTELLGADSTKWDKADQAVQAACRSKVYATRSNYGQFISIVRAMAKGIDMTPCTSKNDMLAKATSASTSKAGRKVGYLTAKSFKVWLVKAGKIVNLSKYDKDDETSQTQMARFERALKTILEEGVAIQAKVGAGLAYDMPALLALVQAPKVHGHIREVVNNPTPVKASRRTRKAA